MRIHHMREKRFSSNIYNFILSFLFKINHNNLIKLRLHILIHCTLGLLEFFSFVIEREISE